MDDIIYGSGVQMDMLPPEVLENIFHFLENEDLHNIMQTCIYIRNVIYKSPLRKRLGVFIIHPAFKRADFSCLARLIEKSSFESWNLHITESDLNIHDSCENFWNLSGWKLTNIVLYKCSLNSHTLSSIISGCINLKEFTMEPDKKSTISDFLNANELNNVQNTSLETLKILCSNANYGVFDFDLLCSFQVRFVNFFPNLHKSVLELCLDTSAVHLYDELSPNIKNAVKMMVTQRPNLLYVIASKQSDNVCDSLHLKNQSEIIVLSGPNVDLNSEMSENVKVESIWSNEMDNKLLMKSLDNYPKMHTMILYDCELDEDMFKKLSTSNVKTLRIFDISTNIEAFASKNANKVLENLYVPLFKKIYITFVNLKKLFIESVSVTDISTICDSFVSLEELVFVSVTDELAKYENQPILISKLNNLKFLGIPSQINSDITMKLPKLKYLVIYSNVTAKNDKNYFTDKCLCPELEMISVPITFFDINEHADLEPQLIEIIKPLKKVRVVILQDFYSSKSIDISIIRQSCPSLTFFRTSNFACCWDNIYKTAYESEYENWTECIESVHTGSEFWDTVLSRRCYSPYYDRITMSFDDKYYGDYEDADEFDLEFYGGDLEFYDGYGFDLDGIDEDSDHDDFYDEDDYDEFDDLEYPVD